MDKDEKVHLGVEPTYCMHQRTVTRYLATTSFLLVLVVGTAINKEKYPLNKNTKPRQKLVIAYRYNHPHKDGLPTFITEN